MGVYAILGGSPMIDQDGVLVQLIRSVERIPTPPPPPCRPRGRPFVYSDRLFLKALIIMNFGKNQSGTPFIVVRVD